MVKLTTYDFIKNAKIIHGDKYDYSQTIYFGRRNQVNIICNEHGLFQQKAGNHLNGSGCPKCNIKGIGNNNKFIISAKQKHGDKYDYSIINYINSKFKISIMCPKHGVFEQTPNMHLNGYGCPKCDFRVKAQVEFIKKANKIHNNKYDYSISNYMNTKTKIKIICPEHGIFEQTPNSHLGGRGCYKCGVINNRLTTAEYIIKAKNIHGNKYDYSLVNYSENKSKIKIICREHGIFEQISNNHLNGQGCPSCNIKSKGELFIVNWLNRNNVNFEIQKLFSDCKNIRRLRYDFYLPNQNLLIEYDGEPHFREVAYLGGKVGFELRQTNDNLKTEYAKNNNIKLLRIPYTERKNISEILKNNITI